MTRLNKQDIRDIRFHKTKAKLLAKLGNEEELNNCYNNILEISYKDEDIEKHDRIRESFFEINNHHHYDILYIQYGN